MALPTFRVLVDWNNDGDYGDANEVVTTYVERDLPLQATRGRDQIRSLSPPGAGTFMATLDNRTRLFAPDYAAGALYGSLLPGRRVRFEAIKDAVTYQRFTGFLDDLPQHPSFDERTVDLPALGVLSRLRVTVSTALYANQTTGTLLGVLLDAVGWPAGDRVIDAGQTIVEWWWLNAEDALDAAVTLLNTEGPGASLYEDGQGRIVFEDRQYRLTQSRCITSQATFSDTGAEPVHRELRYSPGLKDVVNSVSLSQRSRSVKSVAVVWSAGSTITLGPSETRLIEATATGPFTLATTPVAGTDYTFSAGSLISLTLNRTSGARATITLVAGASGATVVGLQLRAQPVTVDSQQSVSNLFDASASIAAHGLRPYSGSVLADLSALTLQGLADAIVVAYQTPRPLVSLVLDAVSDSTATQCVTRAISDRITVTHAQTGLSSADCFIEHITDDVLEGFLTTTLDCEKVGPSVNYWILGQTSYSELEQTTRLGW